MVRNSKPGVEDATGRVDSARPATARATANVDPGRRAGQARDSLDPWIRQWPAIRQRRRAHGQRP